MSSLHSTTAYYHPPTWKVDDKLLDRLSSFLIDESIPLITSEVGDVSVIEFTDGSILVVQ